jgi:hypothetical protein
MNPRGARDAPKEHAMLIRPLSLSPAHPALSPALPSYRRAAAAALHGASRALKRLAHQLAAAPARPQASALAPMIEFHAEAGAPEGALYVDGQLVGRLLGVSRL